MNSQEQHQEAMRIAHLAWIASEEDREVDALALYAQAYQIEKQVAIHFFTHTEGKDFSKAVLFKSAANLAKKAKRYREAEIMIGYGLMLQAPHSILEELRNLYESIMPEVHLVKV